MLATDLLLGVMTICAIVLTVVVSYAVLFFVQTLRQVKKILDDVEDTTSDIAMVKNSLKVLVLTLVSKLYK